MSKKFFTLIFGNTVHTAPKTKVIDGESISKIMSGEEVLENIKIDVEKYRQQVTEECEKLKEQSQKEGYEAGFKMWAEHVVRLEKEIGQVHQELQKLVVPLALKAAKKIVGKEIELSPNVIVDIVASTLKTVSQHKKIILYVNKKEWEIVEAHKQRLRDLFENLESLSIRPSDEVPMGGCNVETEIGIINGQLEHRWNVLEKAFESFLKQTQG